MMSVYILSLSGFLAVGTFAETKFMLPKCWKHHGECLDNNEEPLKVKERVKPKENINVIKTIQNIFSAEDCLSECEKWTDCKYYTHYSRDPLKPCQLVGFNLGSPCQHLNDVCVLHKACSNFDKSCGKACTTGRRLVQDLKDRPHTLFIGGTKQDRTEFEVTGEVMSETGSMCSPANNFAVAASEGAAGAFLADAANAASDNVIVCGGWNNVDKYKTSCETMVRGAGWGVGSQTLATARAYHSMAAVGQLAFVFGGYNAADGMLDTIEEYDLASGSWSIMPAKLPSPRSHTCAVALNYDGKDMVFILGGWGADLTYLSTIVKMDLVGGTLVTDTSFSEPMPADRVGISRGRSDMACTHYRLEGWRDGILLTGGYRSSGAWLNTAWFLDLTVALNSSDTTDPWLRLNDIAQEFDGGRHFHGLSLVEGRPVMVGGWRNGPLADSLVFDECTTTDPTRPGTWQARTAAGHQLTVPREKFVTVSVPKTMIPTPNRCP